MTVPVQTPVTNHTGNGVTTSFPYQFRVLAAADLQVSVSSSPMVLGVDYTITGLGVLTGGSVVFATAPPNGAAISFVRRVALSRDTDYQTSGDFEAVTVNEDFDRIVMMLQDSGISVANAVRLPPGDASSGLLPDVASRALRLFGFDAEGDIAMVPTPAGDATTLALALASNSLPLQGAGLVGHSTSVTYPADTVGARLRIISTKVDEITSVKDYGVLGDGTTDDAAAINAAITAVSAAGGGILLVPKGVYIAGSPVVLRSDVTLQGEGIGATIIRQKAATAMSSTVQTLNAYSLFGGGSVNGPVAVCLRDLQIDANRQNGATGDGLAIYGPVFSLNRIEVCNATGTGVRTEFGVPGGIPHGYSAQANMTDSFIHDCNVVGVRWCGPSDCSLVNCQIYRNLTYNLWLDGPQGSGTKVINCHCWGSIFDSRLSNTSCRIDSGGNLLVNNVFEGATAHQVHMRSSGNVLIGGNIYYLSDATNTYGVTLGEFGVVGASSNTVITRIDNCRAGAVNCSNDLGLNHINVGGYNSGASPTVGLTGGVAATSFINMQISGDASVSNGSTFRIPSVDVRLAGGFGGGSGAISVGAADSGGTGFRALRVPN